MYIVLAILAAMLCGFAFVLQQHAAQMAAPAGFLRMRLVGTLIRNRRWLGGIAALMAGNLLSAWTLGHLGLSVSEPLLSTSLIFALILAVPLTRQALRRSELAGAVLLCTGVAVLSATRSVQAASESFGSFANWPTASIIAGLAAVLVVVGRKRTAPTRATLTGIASGLVLGIGDAFTRRSVEMLDAHQVTALLVNWSPYAAVAASILGLWLMQNAFSAGPLHSSLPAITAAEPAAGMVLGIVVFGESIRITPALLALEAAGVAAMIIGVIMVARAPAFGHLHIRGLPPTAVAHIREAVSPRLVHPVIQGPPALPRTQPEAER